MEVCFQIEYRTIYGEDLYLNILERDGSRTACAMHTRDGVIWSCQMEVAHAIDYFYTVTWQGHEKRSEWVLCPHAFDPSVCATAEGTVVQRDAWMDAPADFRVAGTLVPVFSLRTRRSYGVGDFGDLRQMVDWVARSGQRVLQILPINDTTSSHTWRDSYPYSCISVFALHPIYVELGALPALRDEEARRHFDLLRQQLNAQPQVDYEGVMRAKLDYLQRIYAQEGKSVLATQGFRDFFADAQKWLVPYAQYCHLRDIHSTGDPSQWPDHQQWNEQERKALTSPRTKAYQTVAFWYYVQYVLSTQLAAVHAYARSRGVLLKGDIPIGVARHGADVWQEPRYFNLNGQAGAPPDDFSEDGQNWGFPTYQWDVMLADGCDWWVRRFRWMARYFDAYRIDHVLGFFRIWEIPVPAKSGLWGQFAPALAMTRDEICAYGISEETLAGTVAPIVAAKSDGSVSNECAALVKDAPNFLFLRDHRNPEVYHPRILGHKTAAFSRLSGHEQNAYRALYEDYFYHRNNQLWYDEAMQKLPRLVGATRMLCCAEDLGMVPECVGWVMNELQILSLELESMPKEPWVRFGHVERNPRRSVATISSHDTPTLRMWWDEDYERTQDYFNNILHRDGPAPHPLPGSLAREIIQRHLDCPSMLCIIALQDWLATDEHLRLQDAQAERVNIPANPNHYWRYRMHVGIEHLASDKAFTEGIMAMVVHSGRL